MSTYATILSVIILASVLGTRFPKPALPKKFFTSAGTTVILVSIPFWLWDALATARRDWWFAPHYTGKLSIAGLPLEEMLFFWIAPFGCLVFYARAQQLLRQSSLFLPWVIFTVSGIGCALGAIVFANQYYTATVLSCVSILCFWIRYAKPTQLHKNHFWIGFFLSLIPFLLCNYLLTALPIVLYNQHAIWGIRITTIPIEDFFFHICLVVPTFLVYDRMSRS